MAITTTSGITDLFFDGTNGTSSTEEVIFVTSENDFPTPVGGISDLGSKIYVPATPGIDIDVSFRLRYDDPSGKISGLGNQTSFLNFTNTSSSANIINTTGVTVVIDDCFLRSPNAPLFDCTGDALSLFSLNNVIIDDCADIGQVTDFVRNVIDSPLIGFNVTGGLRFLGNSSAIVLNNTVSAANNTTPTFSMNDAGLVCQTLQLDGCRASLLTGTNKFANIDPTKITRGLLQDCLFEGSSEPLGSTVDNTTINFIINRVIGVEDTRKIGEIDLDSPVTVTITVQGTPVVVGGTWSGNALSQFQVNGAGVQYIGEDSGEVFKVDVTINGVKPGGAGSETYQGRILLEGSLIGFPSAVEISDKGGSIIMHTFTNIMNLDTITMDISDETATTDLDIVSANVEINRVK